MPIDISTLGVSHESLVRDARDHMQTLDDHLRPSLARMLREEAAIERQAQLLDLQALAGVTPAALGRTLAPEVFDQVTSARGAFEAAQTLAPPTTFDQIAASALEAQTFSRGPLVDLALSQGDALQWLQGDAAKALGRSGFHETIAQLHEATLGLSSAVEAFEALTSTAAGSANWQVLPDSIASWRAVIPQDVWEWLEHADEDADTDTDIDLSGRSEISTEPAAAKDDTLSTDAPTYTEILVKCEGARVRLRTLARRFDLMAFGDDATPGADASHVVAVSEGVPALAMELAKTAGPFLRYYRLLYAPCGASRGGGAEDMALADLQALALAAQEFVDVLQEVERSLDS